MTSGPPADLRSWSLSEREQDWVTFLKTLQSAAHWDDVTQETSQSPEEKICLPLVGSNISERSLGKSSTRGLKVMVLVLVFADMKTFILQNNLCAFMFTFDLNNSIFLFKQRLTFRWIRLNWFKHSRGRGGCRSIQRGRRLKLLSDRTCWGERRRARHFWNKTHARQHTVNYCGNSRAWYRITITNDSV